MIKYSCETCNKKFLAYPCRKRVRFCSKSCLAKKIWKGRKHSPEVVEKMRKSPIWGKLNELMALYDDGNTLSEISKIEKINRNTLRTIFRIVGKKMRWPHPRKGIKSFKKGKPYYAIRGDKNPNWKGGITKLTQQIRSSIEMKGWIRTIRERDNYTCQICGKRGGDNNADHYPKSFSQVLKENNIKSYQDAQKCDELWLLSNGRTLCLKCHNKTKKYSK